MYIKNERASTMDSAHEAELARILENRRLRGALKSSAALKQPNEEPSVQQRPAAFAEAPTSLPPRSSVTFAREHSPPRGAASYHVDPTNKNYVGASASSPRRPADQGPPQALPRARTQTTTTHVTPAAPRAAFVLPAHQHPPPDTAEKLREAQALQEKKVDQLQVELRRGLTEIRETLQAVLHEQRQQPVTAVPLAAQTSSMYGDTSGVPRGAGGSSVAKQILSGFSATKMNVNDRREGLVETPKPAKMFRSGQETPLGARSGNRPVTAGRHRSAAMDDTDVTDAQQVSGAPLRMLSAPIIPGGGMIPLFEGTSRYESELKRQATANHFAPRSAAGGGYPSSGAADAQPVVDPPMFARPFSKSTIDIRSCFTILREGDWWFKWDSAGHKVHLRWVWLDTTRRCFSWAHKQTVENPMFGPRIPIEDMTGVTTSEIQETDPHGNPRRFYVLLIECTTRMLQLGTERRDKLNVWYEAVNNIIVQVRQAAQNRVMHALAAD